MRAKKRDSKKVIVTVVILAVVGFVGNMFYQQKVEAAKAEELQRAVTLYKSYLHQNHHMAIGALIYLDEDDIPELYLSGIDQATGSRLIYISDGEVMETYAGDELQYAERENNFLMTNYGAGAISQEVCHIEDGEIVTKATMIAEELPTADGIQLDFRWTDGESSGENTNWITLTEEEYYARLQEALDGYTMSSSLLGEERKVTGDEKILTNAYPEMMSISALLEAINNL